MIGFRVDANDKIASGHLMRCIAIATECRKRGEACFFWLAEDKETFRLRDRQFPYGILHSDWMMLEDELPVFTELLRKEPLNWLVVDSYQATPQYLAKLNQIVPVMYIDDMAQETYDVSALLHYGLCADLEGYQERYGNTNIQILAGIEYTPLREEFLPLQERRRMLQEGALKDSYHPEKKYYGDSIPEREKSILITTGGTDPYNITGELLECCLVNGELKEYQYHIIVGSMNEHEEKLQNMAWKHQHIHLHKNVTNMSDYMRRCEMAVSAGGTTLLELCACGIPTVCFSFADNQQPGTYAMGQRGIMQYAGDARDVENLAAHIMEGLLRLVQNKEIGREYALRMQKLVDGRGAERIADVLCRQDI